MDFLKTPVKFISILIRPVLAKNVPTEVPIVGDVKTGSSRNG